MIQLPTGNKPEFTKAPPKLGTLARAEYDAIKAAVTQYEHEGMRSLCARLGVGKATLYYKLKKYGIKPNKVGRTRASYEAGLYVWAARTGKPKGRPWK